MKELLLRVSQEGIHGLYLLVFTLLIWLVFFLILAANPGNKINQWCFATGFLCGIGTFKEFLYYELAGLIHSPAAHAIPDWLYSVMSGVFYFFSLPCGLICALYFSHEDVKNPSAFRKKQAASFALAVVMILIFPCTQTLYYQSKVSFCLSTAAYNWLYGIILTSILLKTLREERLSANYNQRMLVTASVLLPLWCWLIAGFPYHALGLEGVSKAWQINLIIIVVILLFIVYHAFHSGIWGLRIRGEQYNWSSDEKLLQKNAHYVGHALKNDLAKISWCTGLLRQEQVRMKELDIIEQSVAHLESFVARTQMYSDRIVLKQQFCDIVQIFEDLKQELMLPEGKQIQICTCDMDPLFCDPVHLAEVLRNLIWNAAESIKEEGLIKLSYHCQKNRRQAVITVRDNGCGIEKDDLKRISEPFYTTKNNNHNMGLGLYYCWNVMCAHSGRLQADSAAGEGSCFSLYFPYVNPQKGASREKNKNHGGRR